MSEWYKTFTQYTALLALFSIPFGTKKFLYLFWGAPNELNAIFLFGIDLLALIFISFIFLHPRFRAFLLEFRVFIPFILLSLFSLLFSTQFIFSAYRVGELFLAFLFAFALAFSIREKILPFSQALLALFLSALLQALIAFFQFFNQASVGLRLLGESQIALWDYKGVARVAIEGVGFLRAYGTLPHANILAAFLGVGILAGCALWLYGEKKKTLVTIMGYTSAFFILFAGLVFSFSRSGWIASVFGVAIFCVFAFFSSRRRETLRLIFLLLLILGGIFFSLSWAISPRAHFSVREPSVNLRALYNQMGVEIIKENPLGVGIGNQVSYADVRGMYPRFGIYNEWDIQPIHNLFILISTELGIAGLFAFLFSFKNVFLHAFRNYFRGREFVLAIFLFLFVFGLFDHFFWTLASGRLMFWGALGIVMGVASSSPATSVGNRSFNKIKP